MSDISSVEKAISNSATTSGGYVWSRSACETISLLDGLGLGVQTPHWRNEI